MGEVDLKKLNRGELLELMLEQGKEIQRLTEQVSELEEKLRDRELRISECGSISEAAISLNGVMESAQNAADQYVENVRVRALEQEVEAQRLYNEKCAKADEIYRKAVVEADAQREKMTEKMLEFYDAHQELKELLETVGLKQK